MIHIKINFIKESYSIESYVSKFLAGDLDKFGTWAGHVGKWIELRRSDRDFIWLRYEDLYFNPYREVQLRVHL